MFPARYTSFNLRSGVIAMTSINLSHQRHFFRSYNRHCVYPTPLEWSCSFSTSSGDIIQTWITFVQHCWKMSPHSLKCYLADSAFCFFSWKDPLCQLCRHIRWSSPISIPVVRYTMNYYKGCLTLKLLHCVDGTLAFILYCNYKQF